MMGYWQVFRSCCSMTSVFSVTTCFHQRLVSLYLFAPIMDELITNIQEDVSWCMLFADGKVLIDEKGIRSNIKLDL